MKRLLPGLTGFLLLSASVLADTVPTIPVLAWHDIVEKRRADAFAITRVEFAAQMAWLKEAGYTPIRLDDLEGFRSGRRRLPAKPVLLTFDDGLSSYRDIALPILRRYGYPSVLSIVTGWHDGDKVPRSYRGKLLSWPELRALSKMKHVEIISHSHALHRSIPSNPQGNRAPAGITRRYERSTARYESEAAFRVRIRRDLTKSRRRFERELGYAPKAIAWPFGQYDQVLIEEAARLGMHWHLTLDTTPTTLTDLPRINRVTFLRYRRIGQFEQALTHHEHRRQQQRFLLLTLDEFSGKTSAEQERHLSVLLSRMQLLRINTVIIDPFSADRRRAFFPNNQVPVAANVLNRLLHQLKARLEIHHLILQLPARPAVRDWRPLYTELARLNRFSAVVIVGKTDPRTRAATRELFRYYHPDLRFGVMANGAGADQADFIVAVINPALPDKAIEQQARALAQRHPRAMVLLSPLQRLPNGRLLEAMRQLREAGIAHYGIGPDVPAVHPRALLPLAQELVTYTIVAGEGG